METDNVALQRVSQLAEIASACDGSLRTLWWAFVRHGRPMRPERLTIAEARLVVKAARDLGGLARVRPKQCYFNAQQIILHPALARRFQYVEGYVCDPVVNYPIEHAWLLLNGKVVDLTLRALGRTREYHYLGMVIRPDLVRRNALATGKYCPVTDGPFQREAFPK